MRDQWTDRISQLQGTVGFLGLGSESWGDDALGLVLARKLRARGFSHVHEAGTAPERWITETNLRSLDHLVFLDAVDWGGSPGDAVLLTQSEIQQRFPQISTHKLSLGLLAAYVAHQGRTQAWLLGVQHEVIAPGAPLTERVRETIEVLSELLALALVERQINSN